MPTFDGGDLSSHIVASKFGKVPRFALLLDENQTWEGANVPKDLVTIKKPYDLEHVLKLVDYSLGPI